MKGASSDRRAAHVGPLLLGMAGLSLGGMMIAVFLGRRTRQRRRRQDADIATVSHELKTPLTSIIGALRLLNAAKTPPLSAESARLIRIAESNASRMIRLLDDLIQIERIETRGLHMSMRPIDLKEVIERVCHDSQAMAHASGVVLSCTLPAAPLRMDGDADRLIQLVSNLIHNAVKISDAGGRVAVSVSRDESTGRAIVTIDDEGPGVPDDVRDRIFGRFERAASDRGTPGTGLGLAIARGIAIDHQGEIWFEDRRKGGTRFVFALPVAERTAVSRRTARADRHPPAGRVLRVGPVSSSILDGALERIRSCRHVIGRRA